MEREFTLDESQLEAASIAPEERQIVVAGPGSGKSEVVGALAARLVEQGVYPPAILVISFSRAAVDVVRRRTESVTEEGQGVDLSTIDSLAARVIAELVDEDVPFSSYDRNIELASTLLEQADEPVFDDLEHIIVDELQDVVGVRARFVEALLTKAVRPDTGFSLLGDPMQSIYGFAEKDVSVRSAERLLERLQGRFRTTPRRLSGAYRARTRDARRVAEARNELLGLSGECRLRQVRSLLAELTPLGGLDQEVARDISEWRGTTALLCDTNARAALLAEHCAALDLVVDVAESAAQPALAPWLAEVFAGEGSVVDRDEFLDRAAGADVADPSEAWRALVTLSDSRRALDVQRLGARLADRTPPAALRRSPESRVVASTVHRAKGLEFDNVVMVDPELWIRDARTDPDDAARLLFVAASRAHSRLTVAHGPDATGWSRNGRGAQGRWEHRPFPRAFPDGTLISPADLLPVEVSPSGRGLGADSLVEWWRNEEGHVDADGESIPAWDAVSSGRVIATTGFDFGRYMARRRDVDRLQLLGGRVTGWETRISTGAAGRHEFPLLPRIAGPMMFERS